MEILEVLKAYEKLKSHGILSSVLEYTRGPQKKKIDVVLGNLTPSPNITGGVRSYDIQSGDTETQKSFIRDEIKESRVLVKDINPHDEKDMVYARQLKQTERMLGLIEI